METHYVEEGNSRFRLKTILPATSLRTGRWRLPLWLRKEFVIEEGTRTLVCREGDRTFLNSISPRRIKGHRGSLKGSGMMRLMDGRKRERGLK
jgi:hypothetical protein